MKMILPGMKALAMSGVKVFQDTQMVKNMMIMMSLQELLQTKTTLFLEIDTDLRVT